MQSQVWIAVLVFNMTKINNNYFSLSHAYGLKGYVLPEIAQSIEAYVRIKLSPLTHPTVSLPFSREAVTTPSVKNP